MAAGVKARLLIVDDSSSIRAALKSHLGQRGYDVVGIADGAEALSLLSAGDFDLVVLDVVMRGMDGLDVLSRIRAEHSKVELPVLMVTARTDSADVVRALELGANDYITKPIDLPVATARIESQLQMRAQVTSLTSRHTPLEPDGSVPIGTVLDGRYELKEKLGAGGYAVVYEAVQSSTGQTVAVKLLRAHRAATPSMADEELARFRREVELIRELAHPHIVRLIDSGWLDVRSTAVNSQPVVRVAARDGSPAAVLPNRTDVTDGSEETVTAVRSSDAPPESVETRIPFIVMERLRGESLRALIKREGPLSVERTVSLLLPVISALWAAHARGVIHRDLKPGNILLAKTMDGDVRPTVLDFGVAKLVSDKDIDLTASASMLGTPGYWSPEQARGLALDPRSDQYTLAAMIYQCVTGQKPFDGRGMELVHRIANGSFEAPTTHVELLPGFEAIILRGMATEPAERYPTLRALARDLLPYADERDRALWGPAFEQGGTTPPP